LFKTLREDIQTVFKKDPAAKSLAEVILCYPGLHAIWLHRLASYLWWHRFKLFARLLSQLNRFLTLIEIHPGATIGRRVFIDHGAGVVIGETARVGDDVLVYQGVVLGGTSLKKGRRHPSVGNNVVMGTGAVALGNITIGDGAKIGSGSVVIKSVAPGVTVVGIPGRAVEDRGKPTLDLEHGNLPDPVAEAIRLVLKRNDILKERLERIEESFGVFTKSNDYSKPEKLLIEDFIQGSGI
jgi:serine O-acetyltransferase